MLWPDCLLLHDTEQLSSNNSRAFFLLHFESSESGSKAINCSSKGHRVTKGAITFLKAEQHRLEWKWFGIFIRLGRDGSRLSNSLGLLIYLLLCHLYTVHARSFAELKTKEVLRWVLRLSLRAVRDIPRCSRGTWHLGSVGQGLPRNLEPRGKNFISMRKETGIKERNQKAEVGEIIMVTEAVTFPVPKKKGILWSVPWRTGSMHPPVSQPSTSIWESKLVILRGKDPLEFTSMHTHTHPCTAIQ